MEVKEAIRTRRSIRKFLEKQVGEAELREVLEAARWAPSGLNNQPWKLVVVRDRGKAGELAECTKYSSIVRNAPVLICVFLDHSESYDRDKDLMAMGALMQNMLLAAHSLGLGAVWLGEILREKEKVREILRVPPGHELTGVVAMGWPAERKERGERKPLDEIVLHYY
ncbi:MAG: nitroreductase [Candidatus Geothermincolales bacterium]